VVVEHKVAEPIEACPGGGHLVEDIWTQPSFLIHPRDAIDLAPGAAQPPPDLVRMPNGAGRPRRYQRPHPSAPSLTHPKSS